MLPAPATGVRRADRRPRWQGIEDCVKLGDNGQFDTVLVLMYYNKWGHGANPSVSTGEGLCQQLRPH
jgi:hypothetical protein